MYCSFLQAVDVDAGNNSNIAYTLIDEKNGNIFTVEKSTGWVRSAQSFTGKVGQSYNLKVLAQDNGGTQPNFNDTTMVKVRKQLMVISKASIELNLFTFKLTVRGKLVIH